jgi:hypothetical protein
MTHKTKAISYDARIRAFWTLSAISVLAFAVYIYSVNMTIRNTALRSDLEAQVGEMSVDQSGLEFAYIKKSREINMDVAYAHGFHDAPAPLYVSRTTGSALTYNTRTR